MRYAPCLYACCRLFMTASMISQPATWTDCGQDPHRTRLALRTELINNFVPIRDCTGRQDDHIQRTELPVSPASLLPGRAGPEQTRLIGVHNDF
jgi:hypothetical protein